MLEVQPLLKRFTGDPSLEYVTISSAGTSSFAHQVASEPSTAEAVALVRSLVQSKLDAPDAGGISGPLLPSVYGKKLQGASPSAP